MTETMHCLSCQYVYMYKMNVRFIIENAIDFAPVIFLIHFPCNVIVSNEYVCQFNRKKAVKHISNWHIKLSAHERMNARTALTKTQANSIAFN